MHWMKQFPQQDREVRLSFVMNLILFRFSSPQGKGQAAPGPLFVINPILFCYSPPHLGWGASPPRACVVFDQRGGQAPGDDCQDGLKRPQPQCEFGQNVIFDQEESSHRPSRQRQWPKYLRCLAKKEKGDAWVKTSLGMFSGFLPWPNKSKWNPWFL